MYFFRYLYPQTLKSKLRLTLFVVGFFPYLLILIYSYHLGEEKIVDRALMVHQHQMKEVKEHLFEQFHHLQKEVAFLSSLEMMNDMIVDDIDRRIAQLLMQKEQDLGLKMELLAIDEAYHIVSSSKAPLPRDKRTKFDAIEEMKKAIKEQKKYFLTQNYIVFFHEIYSTLEQGVLLGYLVSYYHLENLQHFTSNELGLRSMLYQPKTQERLGAFYREVPLELKASQRYYLTDDHMVLYQPLEGILSQWWLVYMVEKSTALRFLENFILFVWGLLVMGFITITLISLWISRRILEPIATLSKATKSIIETKDYTTQVSKIDQGEIGELSDDFNAMIRETNDAFIQIEEESKERLRHFVQLITIFNHLIQTQTQADCVEVALRELKSFMPHQRFRFCDHFPTDHVEEAMMLYVQNFESNCYDFYGVIYLDGFVGQSKKHEKRLYRAIATMIMLQLDHIKLIEKTQEVSHAKSTFISHMSHELRTPLHTILSATQYLIGYGNLNEDQQRTIGVMESSADHLLGMINDILDLVQIEAGKVKITHTRITAQALMGIVEEVISMLEVLADSKSIALEMRGDLLASVEVALDIKLFKQIVINLLSNAIKFTHEGSITLEMKQQQMHIAIEIKDTGIGIAKEDLSTLFSDFAQIKNRSTHTQKGSGLGLVISQKLAKLLGGEVKLESEGRGKGAVATLLLPSKP
jgi:signal transduction histidine kinase